MGDVIIYTAAGVPLNNVLDLDGGVTWDSDPRTCNYTHFDLSSEQLGRTMRYNCWGFTFLPRRYWIGSSTDVDLIIQDNCIPIADGSVQVGDVIRYRSDSEVTTHTGRVWSTDGAGHATFIRSKWGSTAEYIHPPLGGSPPVPSIYGTNLAYFRQVAPLRGIADLWIKDSPADAGEQYSGVPYWTSPDILVDVPPYDGVPDINPVFDYTNRVWAVVTNRCDEPIEGVYVRYYWADPSAGLAPSNWNLIPGTPGHPNPAGPLSIAGGDSIEAPYVEWVPTASPAHQCLLAIAYINDDPRDSNNPDPIVYSFDIPWDNNIAQRNVHVIPLEPGNNDEISIGVGIPFEKIGILKGKIKAVLTHSSRLPLLGFTREVIPIKVTLTLNKKRKFTLKPLLKDMKIQIQRDFRFQDPCRWERPLASVELPIMTFKQQEVQHLNVKISAPKDAKKGSIYYLHIFQHVSNMVTGGYTTVVEIV